MESRLVTLLRKVLIEKNFDLKLDKRLYSEFTVLKVKKKTVIIKENDTRFQWWDWIISDGLFTNL